MFYVVKEREVADVEQDGSDLTTEELESFRQEREYELHHWKIRAQAFDLAELCENEWWLVKAINALSLEYRRRHFEPDGYLYVLRAGPYYKIGRTIDLPGRIRRLKSQIQLPWPVEVVYTFPCEDMVAAESFFHRNFARKRMNGEWFELDNIDLRWFENLKDSGILYLEHDVCPEAVDPVSRPEWSEPFVDEVTEKIVTSHT